MLKSNPNTKYISFQVNVWYQPDDQTIHITSDDFGNFHTTVNDVDGSMRQHHNLYKLLSSILAKQDKWPEGN